MNPVQTQEQAQNLSFQPDYKESDFRECPECGEKTIVGMPGGRDATCKNCGYKDPCCYD